MPKREKEERDKGKSYKSKDKGALIIYIILGLAIAFILYFLLSRVFQKTNANVCPKDILPEKILILESQSALKGSEYEDRYVIRTIEWADGVPLIIKENESDFNESFLPDCPKGSSEGGNSSYLYCRDAFYNSEGTTGNKAGSYIIKLVLKPIANEVKIERYFIFNRIYRNYTIISAECIKQ